MIAKLRFVERRILGHGLTVEIDGEPDAVDEIIIAVRRVKKLQEHYEEK